MADNRTQFTNLSTLTRMLRSNDFLKPENSNTTEALEQNITKIVQLAIAEMHAPLPYRLNPYTIGISYLYQFFHKDQEDRYSGDNYSRGIHFPESDFKPTEMLQKWRTEALTDGPLSGVVFLADKAMKNSMWCQMLINNKATLLGYEKNVRDSDVNQGAAFHVANHMAVFSIVSGHNGHIVKHAQSHSLFTLTIRSNMTNNEGATITTRNFEDLKSVAHCLKIPSPPHQEVSKAINNKYSVIFVLGYGNKIAYRYILALREKLSDAGFRSDYYHRNEPIIGGGVTREVKCHQWERHLGSQRASSASAMRSGVIEKFDVNEHQARGWQFILSTVDAVTAPMPATDASMAFDPVSMTIPVNHRLSIEITRRVGVKMTLLQFASEVVPMLDDPAFW